MEGASIAGVGVDRLARDKTRAKPWGGGMFLSATAACNGWNHKHLVAVLKAVLVIAEEADVFFVDVKIDEAAHMTVFTTQMWTQSRKAAFNLGDEGGQIGGAGDFANVVGVLLKCIGQ